MAKGEVDERQANSTGESQGCLFFLSGETAIAEPWTRKEVYHDTLTLSTRLSIWMRQNGNDVGINDDFIERCIQLSLTVGRGCSASRSRWEKTRRFVWGHSPSAD